MEIWRLDNWSGTMVFHIRAMTLDELMSNVIEQPNKGKERLQYLVVNWEILSNIRNCRIINVRLGGNKTVKVLLTVL